MSPERVKLLNCSQDTYCVYKVVIKMYAYKSISLWVWHNSATRSETVPFLQFPSPLDTNKFASNRNHQNLSEVVVVVIMTKHNIRCLYFTGRPAKEEYTTGIHPVSHSILWSSIDLFMVFMNRSVIIKRLVGPIFYVTVVVDFSLRVKILIRNFFSNWVKRVSDWAHFLSDKLCCLQLNP